VTRVRRQLTSAGWFALALVLPFYLAALTSQSALLLVLVGLILGCLTVNALACKSAVLPLQPLLPTQTRWTEGEPVLEPWGVHNPAAHAVAGIEIRSGTQTLWKAPWIAPRSSSHLSLDPPALPRGEYPLEGIEMHCAHPFGLIKAIRPLEDSGRWVVHPKLPDLDAPPVGGHEAVLGGRQRGPRRVASGSLFAGVRPHQSGDALNQIHWKSTAKGLGLWVKTYEEELSGKVSLLLDDREKCTPQDFEAALRACGGLAFAALDAGHQVEWCSLSDGSFHMWTPFTDAELILDELARARQRPAAEWGPLLESALNRASKRSSISVILAKPLELAAAEIQDLRSRERSVTLFAPASATHPDFDIPMRLGGLFDEHGQVKNASTSFR